MSMEEEKLHMDALRMSIQPPMTVKEEKDTSWEDRFDEKFPNTYYIGAEEKSGEFQKFQSFSKEYMRDFIHQEREALLKEIMEGVGKMEMDRNAVAPLIDDEWFKGKNKIDCYNDAIKHTVSLIKNL